MPKAPDINKNVPSISEPQPQTQAVLAVLKQLKAGIESLAGMRGGVLQRAVTFEDLIALGIVSAPAAQSSTGSAPPPLRVPGIGVVLSDGTQLVKADLAGGIVLDGGTLTLSGVEFTANKDAANGYAGLDAGGLLHTSELPAGIEFTANKDAANGYAGLDAGGLLHIGEIPAGVELTAHKGAASGYAGLDGSGTVPTAQLPATVGYVPATHGLVISDGTVFTAGTLTATNFVYATGTASIGQGVFGLGLNFASGTLDVKPATTAALGGVIAGSGITVDIDGTIHAAGGTPAGAIFKRTDVTATGSWTPDAACVAWTYAVIGGGGGGGSGAREPSGTACSGGGAGAPGDIKLAPGWITAIPGAPVSITIGATGTGGTGVSSNGNGNAGVTGGNATLGLAVPVVARGGGGGGAGNNAALSNGGSGPSDIAAGVANSTINVSGSLSTLFNGLGGGAGASGTALSTTTFYGNPGGAGCAANGTSNPGNNGIYKHAAAGSGGGNSSGGTALAGGAGGGNFFNATGATAGAAAGGAGNPATLPLSPWYGANGASGGGGAVGAGVNGGAGGDAPAGGYGIPGAGGGASASGTSGRGGNATTPAVVILELLHP